MIENNIIFTAGGSPNRICVREESDTADPSALHNNLLFDCPKAFYYDIETDTEITNIADVNDAAQTTQGAAETASGNVTGDPGFISLGGTDGIFPGRWRTTTGGLGAPPPLPAAPGSTSRSISPWT